MKIKLPEEVWKNTGSESHQIIAGIARLNLAIDRDRWYDLEILMTRIPTTNTELFLSILGDLGAEVEDF